MGLMLNNHPIKGEMYLGEQVVGKMYYNNKLVYENGLPSGTVVFDEGLNIPSDRSIQITLKNVEVGMTNISKGLNIGFQVGSAIFTQFASVEDLKKGIYLSAAVGEILKFAWKTGTNKLYVRALANNVSLLNIKVA